MHRPATKTNPVWENTFATDRVGPCFPAWLVAALLALVTIALYWPATHCDFINLDDPAYVTANPHVQGGLSREGVKWAFCSMDKAAYWAPLTWLSHMLACQLFGLNPSYTDAENNLRAVLAAKAATAKSTSLAPGRFSIPGSNQPGSSSQ